MIKTRVRFKSNCFGVVEGLVIGPPGLLRAPSEATGVLRIQCCEQIAAVGQGLQTSAVWELLISSFAIEFVDSFYSLAMNFVARDYQQCSEYSQLCAETEWRAVSPKPH